MRVFGQGASDAGRHRTVNEDRFLVDNELQLYAVADGMGGRTTGEAAAELALEVLRQEVRRLADGVWEGDAAREALLEAFQRACAAVYEAAQHPARGGLGCTLTALWVVGSVGVMGHIGASRLYVLRGGELTQLSQDHTVAAEVLERLGREQLELRRDQALEIVLTRHLGSEAVVEASTRLVEVLPGDSFLLCTDGVTRGLVGAPALRAALESQPRHAQPAALVQAAVEADVFDNATAVLMWVRAPEPPPREHVTDVERHLGALSQAFLFEGLDLGELSSVLQACESVKHPRGARLLEPGQRCEQLMIPVYGRLALMLPRGGVEEVGASVVLGASTLLRPRGARCGVRVLEPTRLLVLTRSRFEALARERPALGVALLTRLARHLSAELDAGEEGEGEEASRERALRRLV